MKITSNKMEIKFKDSPLNVESLFINSTDKILCENGTQSFLIRTPKSLSDPILLTNVGSIEISEDRIKFQVFDPTEDYKIICTIAKTENGLKYSIDAETPEPIWLIEWKLSGLDLQKILVPALGGQSLDKNMPAGSTLSYKYPFWWNAQFVLGETENGCLILDGKDVSPDLKLLRVTKETNGFALSYGAEAPAPLTSKKFHSEWYLEFVEGSWENSVDYHREWLEENFHLNSYKVNPSFPEWMDKINFVLEPWGARKSLQPSHTFKQMTERLYEFKKFHNPENTLVYLAGFAENGIDSHAPDYNPSEQCGGREEFKKLVDEAHTLGYKVMIHTNVLALTYGHKIYDEFKKYQVIDVFERPQGWAMDIDGDWLTEPFFAYVNPGFEEWGDYMSKMLGDLIDEFKLDAVFLDQTLLAFNVSSGPNFLTGMRNHVKKLHKNFPNVLFAGEGLHEQVLEALPVAQIHGIDSIAEVHGMEGQLEWRKVHPVSVYLFNKYTKFTGHLLTKHPSHPMFKLQEESYAKLGVIPTLCLYDYNQKIDLPEVHKMIERAKELNKEG